MIYTVERTKLVTEQLLKLKNNSSWIVVGQFANLDFWIDEVKNSLKAINEHNARFDKMYNAQKEWIEKHEIIIPDNCPVCQGICELGNGSIKPNLPKRSAQTKNDKKESKRELIDAAYLFIVRCYKLKLISETELRQICKELGTSIDLNDL